MDREKNISVLLKRIEMFLVDKEWSKVDEYCERVLDIEPECAEAYLYKLLTELKLDRKECLKNCEIPFCESKNFQKAIKFGDEDLRSELSGYIDFIKEKNEKAREEAERKAEIKRKKAKERAKVIKKIAMIATSSVCAIVACAILFNSVILPAAKYKEAVKLMESGEYENAISLFEGLGDYKDSKEKIEEVKKQSLANPVVGHSVWFGSYEQDNNTSNGKEDIQWLALDKKDGKVLLLSKYALDCKPYNERKKEKKNKNKKDVSFEDILRTIDNWKEDNGATWESSTIRKWLNDEFLKSAFSEEERGLIPMITVSADKNPKYDTEPGNDTRDKVFLLSIIETNKYFVSNDNRKCKITDYAFAQGVVERSVDGNCHWWLRTPGGHKRGAALVGLSGIVLEEGKDYDDESAPVRPALWINIE